MDIRDEAAESETITMITYNIMWRKQTKERLTGIAEFIKNKDADIVALQETEGFKSGTTTIDGGNYNYLKNKLTEIGYPMQATEVERRTLAVLSKTSIQSYEAFDIGGKDYRKTQTLYTDTTLGKIRIFNVHPDWEELLCEQVRNFMYVVDDYSDYDIFLLGDFNMTLNKECYSDVTKEFFEGCDPVNEICKDTVNDDVSGNYQNYAIDHIFYEKNLDWEVANAYVDKDEMGGEGKSDHYPVVVTFNKKSSECNSDCEGKQCGSDGCGGNCGTCESNEVCAEGICECVSNCEGKSCGDDDGCGGRCRSCESGYVCNTNSWACEAGTCVADCEGKQCGNDGCGGSCGSCDNNKVCINGECKEIDFNCDVNMDDTVNILDLTIVKNNWGWEGDSSKMEADLNKDGKVDMFDLATIINNWTKKY